MNLKKILRSFIFNAGALWLAAFLFEGVEFSGDYRTVLSAGLALTLANLLIRPIVKLLLLPINLLTLGAFRWLANVAALYLTTVIVPQFSISGVSFAGYSNHGFVIPTFATGPFWGYVFISFFVSLVVSFIYWLIK